MPQYGAPFTNHPQPMFDMPQFVRSANYAFTLRQPCLDSCRTTGCRVRCMYSSPLP